MQYKNFNEQELATFKKYQRQSFATLVDIGNDLKPGVTERQTARTMRQAFKKQGVRSYFHVPVALFGDRTAYPGNFGQFEALATDRVLEPGMAVILDAAPIYDGYLVDTSMPFAFGENERVSDLMQKLQPFRKFILDEVRAGTHFNAIEHKVDNMVRELGAKNCHRKHIGMVMGHRVMKMPARPWSNLRYKMMAVPQVSWFLLKSYLAQKGWQKNSPTGTIRAFATTHHRLAFGQWNRILPLTVSV